MCNVCLLLSFNYIFMVDVSVIYLTVRPFCTYSTSLTKLFIFHIIQLPVTGLETQI